MAASASKIDEQTFPDVEVKRICNHMNEDHAVSVFAMAKRVCKPSGGWKLTGATMNGVNLAGCQIQATLCKKTLCRQEKCKYTFDPPISNPAHVRSKLIAVHHRVCRPDWSKLSFLFIATNFLFMAFLVNYIGRDEMVDFIEQRRGLRRIIRRLVFNSETFAAVVQFIFYFTLIGHGLLCVYAGYNARKQLKLTKTGTTEWSLATLLGGLSVVGDLRDLLEIHYTSSKKS